MSSAGHRPPRCITTRARVRRGSMARGECIPRLSIAAIAAVFYFRRLPPHRSHLISERKRTRKNVDKPIVITGYSATFPLRGKTKIGCLTGPDIDERTAVNVPSGSLSACTRICLGPRAVGISKPRAGIAAVTAVPFSCEAQSKSRSWLRGRGVD